MKRTKAKTDTKAKKNVSLFNSKFESKIVSTKGKYFTILSPNHLIGFETV